MAPTGETGWRSFCIHEIAGILSKAEGCIRTLGLQGRIARMGKRKMQVYLMIRAAICEPGFATLGLRSLPLACRSRGAAHVLVRNWVKRQRYWYA